MTIRVLAYDKNFHPLGPIGNYLSVTITPKRMSAGVAEVVVAGDHHLVPAMMANGARMRLVDDDLVDGDLNGYDSHFLSGFVTSWNIQGPELKSLITFEVTDDFLTFHNVLGWVNPTAAITAQGLAGTNWEMTGPAETVLKTAMTVNAVTRLGLPIHIPATQGRGATVKAKLRFQSIYDRLIATEDGGAGIENSGIEIGLRQLPDGHPNGPGLILDVWVPRTIPQVINEESGIVESWTTNYRGSTATRAVVSGEGEATLRLMRARTNAARETAIGWKYEVFAEAGQTNDPDEMYEEADKIIADGSPTAGMSVVLSETDYFTAHPSRLWIGDQVSMLLGGEEITDRLNEVTLSSTAEEGDKSTSKVGDVTDDPDRELIQKIRKIARKLRIKSTDNL